MQEIQLTATSYIVLGMIAQAGEATPYELKQMVDVSVGHFWSLPRSQLYAEPARLARAGYLTEDQEQGGRRRKRYAATERGLEALRRWAEAPTEQFTELRDLALLKLFFGADPGRMAEAQLAALRPLREVYEGMRAFDDGAAPRGPWQALEAGVEHVEASIRFWSRIAGAESPLASAARVSP
jgi:PadR family transcriptional regulator AphA